MPNQKVAGYKLGTIEAVKASLKRGANSNSHYIKHVGEDGMVVRFLTEPEEWYGFQEYYDVENRVFVPMVVDEVLPDLRKGGPNAVGLAKRLIYDVPAMEQKEAFDYTSRLSAKLFAGDEAKEGMAAFLGRRKASWAEEHQED